MLQIRDPAAGTDGQVKNDDIILKLDGELVIGPWQLGKLRYGDVNALIVRDRQEILLVQHTPIEDLETSRIILFGGAVFQQPHFPVRQHVRELPSKVYVSHIGTGTPAQSYGLCSTWFVAGVNGIPVADLDSFLKELMKIREGNDVKKDFKTLKNGHEFRTVKHDACHFPILEYKKGPKEGWVRHDHVLANIE